MGNYTFKKTPDETNRFDRSTIEFNSEHEVMDDLIEEFENFLRACGFPLEFWHKLEIVNPNEEETLVKEHKEEIRRLEKQIEDLVKDANVSNS